MTSYIRGPLLHVWLVLSAATVLSRWLHDRAHVLTTIFILLVALVKCRLVIRNYMEVRFAPSWLQMTCDAWLILNLGMLSSFYWFA